MASVNRQTVDLSGFPDLVVIYLGMRVRNVRGLRKLLANRTTNRGRRRSEPRRPLLHENMLFSVLPPHAGMRQYWRDLDSLERWTRVLPHQQWWKDFLRDRRRAGSMLGWEVYHCIVATHVTCAPLP